MNIRLSLFFLLYYFFKEIRYSFQFQTNELSEIL